MRRTVLLIIAAMLAAALPLAAQKYTPSTSWPYMYEEFAPGKVLTWNGTVFEYEQLNINIANGAVHYVRNGTIMQAETTSVFQVFIGNDNYVNTGGRMDKVLAITESGSAVVLRTTVDVDAMSRADIGYGKSSLASTQNISAAALSSSMEFAINRNFDEVNGQRKEGEPLELREVTGLRYNGTFVPASRTDVMKISGIDKDAVKDFIKKEKIKFNRTEDLTKLLDCLEKL